MAKKVFVRGLSEATGDIRWQYSTSNDSSKFVDFQPNGTPLEVKLDTETKLAFIASELAGRGETIACSTTQMTLTPTEIDFGDLRPGEDRTKSVTATCTTQSGTGTGYVKVKKSGG